MFEPIPHSEPLWPLLVITTSAAVLIALTFWTYQGVQTAQGGRRWLLLAIRLAALAVACLVLVRPTWHGKIIEHNPATLIILIDTSKSMLFPDENRQSRAEAVKRDWQDAADLIQTLEREHGVRIAVYQFNSLESRLSEMRWDEPPGGERTAIFAALEEALRPFLRERSSRLLGAVLVSDGRDNTGKPALDSVLARFSQANVPIHTIGMGNPGGSELQPDVVAQDISAPTTARVKDRMTPEGAVLARRFAHHEIEISVLIDGKPVREADNPDREVRVIIKPQNPSETIPVQFPACKLPDRPGEIKVTLVAQPRSGIQELKTNNEISTYVTLTKEGLSVLYLDKTRAFERKYLNRALKGDERITLYNVEAPSEKDAANWRKLLADDLEKNSYDVFILGDIPRTRFNNAILDHIEKKVSAGAGLLMIGGRNSFGDGGWQGSPIERMLPVELTSAGQIEEQPAGPKEIKFVPTEEALKSAFRFILTLDPDDKQNRQIWEQLASLPGANAVGSPRANATVLAKSQRGDTLLAVRDHGGGRAAALAVDTTWAWVRPDKAGTERPGKVPRGTEAHHRFWRQLILWLAQQENAGTAVRVELDYRRLPAGTKEQGITVQALELTPGAGRNPFKDAEFTVEVRNLKSDARTAVTTTPEGTEGKHRGLTKAGTTEEPGEYEVLVTARRQGAPLGEARARFMTFIDDSELLNSAANHTLLEQIARATDGTYRLHGGLRTLLEEIKPQSATQTTHTVKFPDWQEPSLPRELLLFLIFVALISAEWLLRRMWGLV